MNRTYDAIIVGGSFAGLATAMQLRGHRVLLLDEYPIGANTMSACGTPLTTARAMGAESAIQEIHQDIVLHTGGSEISFHSQDPFVTFDYWRFCRVMLAQTNAEVLQARALDISETEVITENGPLSARFVVNATGWRSWTTRVAKKQLLFRRAGYGLETEIPTPPGQFKGLNFFIEKKLVPNGYAWVFPCGETTRFGIGSFEQSVKLRHRLAEFLDRFGLRMADTHGGVLAITRRDPVANGVFLVGDAAGQCLPATGEGIRTAIFNGIHCGQAIANALSGTLSPDEARALYWNQVHSMDRFHENLLPLQTLIARTPGPVLAWAARVCSWPPLTRRIIGKYLIDSGWFVDQPRSNAVKSAGGDSDRVFGQPARSI